MIVGSLFSGIGAIDLGLERSGMRVAWQVEIDDYCNRVLEKHWPSVPKFRDVREVGGRFDVSAKRYQLPDAELICGGFPCQPVSCAGAQLGQEDPRWMWPEFMRIIREIRPRWVLAENVPGLLSNDAGWLFGGILRDLAESGYDAEWDCLPAAAFGAPHIRDRIFLVANPNSEELRSVGSCAQRGLCKNLSVFGGPSLFGSHGRVDKLRESINDCRNTKGREMWAIEPDVDRVAYGVANRVDRERVLGNSVVPQVIEWIGRRIMAVDRAWKSLSDENERIRRPG